MARNIELLLLETVESLGIVGDVVRVKPGFARNYLLPMQKAEFPSAEKIESLKEERAKAAAEYEANLAARRSLIEKLEGITVALIRSCNDRGILYGSVTQRDISDALIDAGYDVDTRAIRLANAIRRVGEYPVPVQFGKDLRAEISVIVEPDTPLEEREEMEIDDEGNLVEKPSRPKRAAAESEAGAESAADEG